MRHSHMHGFFISGTDTDAGKTIITAALVRQLRAQGIDAAPMKVVQTGGGYTREGLPLSSDFEVYCKASSFIKNSDDIHDMVPCSFVEPASPHLASHMENKSCEIDPIINAWKRLVKKYELIVAEGVGGIHVPLSQETTTLHLMEKMSLPTILVIRNCLGCINHALNTITVLRSKKIEIAGAIMTETVEPSPDDLHILQDNPRIIAKLGEIRVLGNVPFIPQDPDSLGFWTQMDSHMNRVVTSILEGRMSD